jgi:hypothetical protein
VFHLICQQNIGDFRLRPCAVLRRKYDAVSSRQGFSGLYEIQSKLNKLSEWCERNSLFLNWDVIASSTHCRDRNLRLLITYFIGICMWSVFVVLSIPLKLSVRHNSLDNREINKYDYWNEVRQQVFCRFFESI